MKSVGELIDEPQIEQVDVIVKLAAAKAAGA